MNTDLLQRYKLTILAAVAVIGMAMSPTIDALALSTTILGTKKGVTGKFKGSSINGVSGSGQYHVYREDGWICYTIQGKGSTCTIDYDK